MEDVKTEALPRGNVLPPRVRLARWLRIWMVGWTFVAAMLGTAFVSADEPADPHLEVFKESMFPSAAECGQCHQRIFSEWASSNHAYASISPMFHKFEQAINTLSSGTIGSFCVRCHQQVGTQAGESRELPLWERSPIAREGVTCVTCHRVSTEFGKVNGEREINPGPIYDAVYNTGRGKDLGEVIANESRYQVSDTPDGDGTPIHNGVIKFDQLGKSEFCVSCHQVTVNLGIKLEVVWEQYRDSPAFREGITCQDCHMGKVPGEADGYDTGHIAIVNGRPVGDPNTRHSNHAFYGPGYPIAHPGIFPFNPRSQRWTIQQWLTFNHEAGWGTKAFEDEIADDPNSAPEFPEAFTERSDREFARVIITQNERLLEFKKRDRQAVMENGMRLDGPFFDGRKPTAGKSLKMRYRVTNVDRGHNVPSGSLGAQPEIWLNVALIDPDGELAWESGYVDSHGGHGRLALVRCARG